jgi:hypothetical protein
MSSELTAPGRIPGSPLRGKHEKVAHALVRGATNREAGLEAGYKDGPGLPGNISRLRCTPAMQERIAELAEIATEQATIEDRWILEDLNFFRRATLRSFFKQDDRGELVLVDGKPQIDFSRVSKEQLRWLAEFTVEKDGRVKIKTHDPLTAIDKAARVKGMFRDKIAFTDPSGEKPGVIERIERVIIDPADKDGESVPPAG